MTASQFAALLNAKKVGRNKWMALCPAHVDHKPSLAIDEGKRSPIVFKCMSHGCDQRDILNAIGMTWRDLLGDRELAPEQRRKMRAEHRIRELEERRKEYIVECYRKSPQFASGGHVERQGEKLVYVGGSRLTLPPDLPRLKYIEGDIQEAREALYPQEKVMRERQEKTHRFISKWGWDMLWEKYLASDQGKVANEKYGI